MQSRIATQSQIASTGTAHECHGWSFIAAAKHRISLTIAAIAIMLGCHRVECIDCARECDLGVIEYGATPTHDFHLHNYSDSPLTVIAIRASCSCQDVSLKEGAVIQPEECVAFAYSLPASLGSRQSGRLVVETDSDVEELKQVAFKLSAESYPRDNLRRLHPAKISPEPQSLYFVDTGKRHSQVLRLNSAGFNIAEGVSGFRVTSEGINVQLLESTPEEMTFEVFVEEDMPASKSSNAILFSFRSLPTILRVPIELHRPEEK